MKQIIPLFLFILPYLALAQYPSNGNQKITLGEQTTADGLVYRGVLGDTALITPSSDTSAYIILDTVNNRFYNYNRSTNIWSMAGVGSISSGLTGVLPVANGGTGQSTLTANKVLVGNGTTGVLQPTNFHWDNTNTRLGIGTSSPKFLLSLFTSTDPQDSLGFTTYKSGSLAGGRQNGALKVVSKTNGAVFGVQNLDPTGFSGIEYLNNSSSLSVFTGFSNSNAEYRVNNIAANGFINFLINGNSELYVKNNGNIGLSTDNPSEALHVVGNARFTAVGAGAYANDLNITSTGVLTTASSDEKYKYNIRPLNYGLETLLQLNPVNFQWIEGEEEDLGFIAQDVAEIIPEAVNTNWNSDLLFRYESLIPILTKAIQEQQALIKALEQRIINLENK
jgi:hypothetical protein